MTTTQAITIPAIAPGYSYDDFTHFYLLILYPSKSHF